MSNQFIAWSNGLSVGNKIIDGQHKKIITLLNKLFNSYLDKDKEEVKQILSELLDYSKYHFETEEKCLRTVFSVEAKAHIDTHHKFIEEVTAINSEFENNSKLLTFKLMTFLQKWITEHIMGVDQNFSKLFKNIK